jgi:hypothetical protein
MCRTLRNIDDEGYMTINPLVLQFLRAVVPRPMRQELYDWYLSRRIERLASRRFIEEAIVPGLLQADCKMILFVGVARYTRKCLKLCREAGLVVWTVDVDPNVARWGKLKRHIVGDVCRIERRMLPLAFDAVIVNGVFGYGINDACKAESALAALAKVMRRDGLLVVGGAVGVAYCQLENMQRYFEPTSLVGVPPHVEFPPDAIQSSCHVYALYRRVATAGD